MSVENETVAYSTWKAGESTSVVVGPSCKPGHRLQYTVSVVEHYLSGLRGCSKEEGRSDGVGLDDTAIKGKRFYSEGMQ